MNQTVELCTANRILDSLPVVERKRVLHCCEDVTVLEGESIGFPHEVIHYVYFPVGCVVALMDQNEGLDETSFTLVGPEGSVGASLAVGVDMWQVRAKVFQGGHALWIPIQAFKHLLQHAPTLDRQVRMDVGNQLRCSRDASMCVKRHTLSQRLAGWLQMLSDRVGKKHMYASHQMLAEHLGASEASVARELTYLVRSRAITDDNGHIEIKNRRSLQRVACRCFDRKTQLNRVRAAEAAGASTTRRASSR